MGKVRRRSIEALLWCGLTIAATGCSSFDWVAVSDQALGEAILSSPPFQSPLTIEVESRLAKPCAQVVAEGSPGTWRTLTETKFAVLAPTSVEDGSSGCSLVPISSATRVGRTSAWKLTASGHWRIPIGIYGLDSPGTFDGIVMDRSLIRSGSVVFPWTFYPYHKMTQVVLAQTTAAERGMKGQVRAELARTSDGWKLVSLEMTPLQPR